MAADRAEALLTSPLGGLDATDLRGLARALRSRDDAVAVPPSSYAVAVTVPGCPRRACGARPPTGPAGSWPCVRLARERLEAGDSRRGGALDPLGRHRLAQPPAPPTERGGQSARLAHRDLDAICALFEVAARAEEQRRPSGSASFLDTLSAQQIPADTLAERGVRGDAVRLLTAHRSKGLEWRLVVVAHVQEGAWPDLRRRDSLLGPTGSVATAWSRR